jgi:hypothetical protein
LVRKKEKSRLRWGYGNIHKDFVLLDLQEERKVVLLCLEHCHAEAGESIHSSVAKED